MMNSETGDYRIKRAQLGKWVLQVMRHDFDRVIAGKTFACGVQHGGGGPGLTEFDALSALEKWVETGEPPEKLIASRSAGSVVERSRPVFPYPVQGRYDGVGDPTDASSFLPFVPTEQRKPSPR